MEQKRKRKFAIAVYFSVATLALILIFTATDYAEGVWRDLMINLATNFLGVVLLFFMVNLFFGLNLEDSISEQIRETINYLERRRSVLADSGESRQRFPTEELFNSAHQIDLLGYSLSGLMYKYGPILAQRVKDGTKVRILVINPKSRARDVIKENSDTKYYTFASDINIALTRIRYVNDEIINASKKPRGSFEVRLTSWIPSCTLVIVNTNTSDGKMTVAINSPSNRNPEDRPYLILEKRDHAQWFDYYVNQFDILWKNAIKWNPPDSLKPSI